MNKQDRFYLYLAAFAAFVYTVNEAVKFVQIWWLHHKTAVFAALHKFAVITFWTIILTISIIAIYALFQWLREQAEAKRAMAIRSQEPDYPYVKVRKDVLRYINTVDYKVTTISALIEVHKTDYEADARGLSTGKHIPQNLREEIQQRLEDQRAYLKNGEHNEGLLLSSRTVLNDILKVCQHEIDLYETHGASNMSQHVTPESQERRLRDAVAQLNRYLNQPLISVRHNWDEEDPVDLARQRSKNKEKSEPRNQTRLKLEDFTKRPLSGNGNNYDTFFTG